MPGSPDEEYGATDSNEPLADQDAVPPDDEAEGYGGASGGAVGGTPAGKRARGGRMGHGIRPGTAHHGDSTVGTDPEQPTD